MLEKPITLSEPPGDTWWCQGLTKTTPADFTTAGVVFVSHGDVKPHGAQRGSTVATI